jgi:integrase
MKNVYDLGGGKWQIVASYRGERKDRIIEAVGIREAGKEQGKLQQALESEVDQGNREPVSIAPLLSQFCAVRNPDADPPVPEHGPYHLHILNRNRIGEKTYKNRLYVLATLLEHMGHLRLDEIGPAQVLEYQDERSADDIEATTINGEVKILRAIVHLAVRKRIPGVQLLTKEAAPDLDEIETEAVPWTEEQMRRLLDAAWRRSRRLYGIVLTLANTGMRRGEAINLLWSCVALDTLTITLRPSKFWKPKDKQPRHIPISPALAEYLQSMKRESAYVFVSRKGEPYAYWPQLQFDEARTTAGLEGGPHRLRHTFASHFLANWSSKDRLGDPMMALAKVLGHSHTQMTKRYSHFLPGHLDNARGLVNFGGEDTAQVKARAVWSAGGRRRRK